MSGKEGKCRETRAMEALEVIAETFEKYIDEKIKTDKVIIGLLKDIQKN